MKVSQYMMFICNRCEVPVKRTIKNIKVSYKKWDENLCKSCTYELSAIRKPQCSKTYWTTDKKKNLSEKIKASSTYIKGIKNRNISKEKNGMYKKKHTLETRNKMSKSRIGKIGPNATAWKGGKNSITKRVKRILQTRYFWFSNVIKRENSICQKCGNKATDAHHIIPIITIIKDIEANTPNYNKFTDDEKVEFILKNDSIIDKDLQNGMALCRTCHKLVHRNWGSKFNP